MATLTCNGITSSSISWSAGTPIDISSSYTILVDGLNTNSFNMMVRFLTGTSEWGFDTSYDGDSVETYSYWTAKGWCGPYTSKKISGGTVELGDSGPSSYGYLSAYKAIFRNVPSTVKAIGVDYYDGSNWTSVYYWALQSPSPKITVQPAITSINPSSGKSTTISWSAASVSNQGSATIYYQYFVGPSSTYSDSYHIGTTTGLSATITEANILAKCGSSFSGTCYLFVRAYWDNGSTQGGWYTPTAKTFVYDPVTLSNPGNAVVSQSAQNFVVSWAAATGSGGSGSVTYVVVVGDEGEIYQAGTSTSISIPIYSSQHGTSVKFRIWAYYSGKEAVCSSYTYFTPKAPSVTAPGKPSITQSGSKYTVSWTGSTGSYGSGGVTYRLYLLTDGIFLTEAGTATSVTLDVPTYGYSLEYRVVAYYSTTEAWSSTTAVTFVDPVSLTAPGNPSVKQSGSSYVVSWTAAIGKGGSGNVSYVVVVGDEGETYQAGTATSITIAIPDAWREKSIKFRVWAYYSGKESVCADYAYFMAYAIALTAPGIPSVTQNDNQYIVSWTPAVGSYGSGSVTYVVVVGDEGETYEAGTSTSISIPIYPSQYGVSVSFRVWAYYSGKESVCVDYAYCIATDHRTVKYSPDGQTYIECIIYYCADGKAYGECVPYECADGQNYIECSH